MSNADSPAGLVPGADVPEVGAAFYLCLDQTCGLRFPVTAGDRFEGCCPACGGAVVQAATVPRRSVPRREAPRQRPALHLLLDNWRSLFNVGSALRTADGAGVAHIHLCGITPTPAHRKLAKTALGAESAVAWSYARNAAVTAAALQAEGKAIWVLEGGPQSRPLWECRLPEACPVVLAAGNEVAGVDPALVEMADRVVYVPMVGIKESLNVAVALSIAVYWLVGQAHGEGNAWIGEAKKTI